MPDETRISQNRYLFIVTSFDKEPDLTAGPLVLAVSALSVGVDVLLWLTHEGVNLAKAKAADHVVPKSFPPLGELLDNFGQAGGNIGVCPPCAKTHGVTEQNMLPNASWMGAAALLGEMQNRQSLSF
ncbi:MAG: DsrE family protein [Acidiferrobacterales bacterium]